MKSSYAGKGFRQRQWWCPAPAIPQSPPQPLVPSRPLRCASRSSWLCGAPPTCRCGLVVPPHSSSWSWCPPLVLVAMGASRLFWRLWVRTYLVSPQPLNPYQFFPFALPAHRPPRLWPTPHSVSHGRIGRFVAVMGMGMKRTSCQKGGIEPPSPYWAFALSINRGCKRVGSVGRT